jgi:hypothetical protein
MTDQGQLLHNMSAPPKSVVKYGGLLAASPEDGVAPPTVHPDVGVFGVIVSVWLPQAMFGRSPRAILKGLDLKSGINPEQTLLELIEQRAKELALPDACLVVPTSFSGQRPWPDALAALAIITKCSSRVWLRSKTPRLSATQKTASASLLVPPAYGDRIKETYK